MLTTKTTTSSAARQSVSSLQLHGSSDNIPHTSRSTRTSAQRTLEDGAIELQDIDGKSTNGRTPSMMGSLADGGPPSAPEFTMSVKDERLYLAALSWCLFLAGWNDATLGPVSFFHVHSREFCDAYKKTG